MSLKRQAAHAVVENEETRVERRRKRERESARRCREKKQKQIQDLEATVAALEERNTKLRKTIQSSRFEHLLKVRTQLYGQLEAAFTDTAGIAADKLNPLVRDIEHNTSVMNSVLQNDAALVPTLVELARKRSAVLWLILTPNPAQLRDNPSLLKGMPSDMANALTIAVKEQLQKEVKLTDEQWRKLKEFRDKNFDGIQRTFERSRQVEQTLTELEKKMESVHLYYKLLDQVRSKFFDLLEPLQQAKLHVWFNRHKHLLRYLVASTKK